MEQRTHGTWYGYQQHRQCGDLPCEPCVAAMRKYQREYKKRKRAIGPKHGPKQPILKTCKSCGGEFWTQQSNHVNCTSQCADQHRDRERSTDRTHPIKCIVCGAKVRRRGSITKYCSGACRTLRFGPYLEEVEPAHGPEEPTQRPCLHCGEPMWNPHSGQKRHAECARQNLIRRTMELYETAYLVADVPRAVMWRHKLVAYLRERDGDLCGLCGKPMEFGVTTGPRGKSDLGATVDHIHPRSLGGDNEESNLQLAHWGCNRAKGNRWGTLTA